MCVYVECKFKYQKTYLDIPHFSELMTEFIRIRTRQSKIYVVALVHQNILINRESTNYF